MVDSQGLIELHGHEGDGVGTHEVPQRHQYDGKVPIIIPILLVILAKLAE